MTSDTVQVPELLAPAGSDEMLVATIASGADAVYLGGKRFGARYFSENFDDDAIARAVSYAHLRGVKVYGTVNTLLFQDEIPEAVRFLIFLYECGVDAVLVQDPGLLALAHDIVPGLALHASTQMTIHNAEGVAWAAKMGVSRVVAARELSLDDLALLVDTGNRHGVGIEVFAHGALCYAYSGQCLFSSLAGGRSGNRGMCAQPCRKKYDLIHADTDTYGRPIHAKALSCRDNYLLSTRDLCTYEKLRDLVAGGVCAVKIEGRMRSPGYAATVTSIYRRALDAMAAGTFVPRQEELDDLALAFSRGFTRGYLFGEHGPSLMGRDLPDDRGLPIGTVEPGPQYPGMVRVHVSGPVRIDRGDGLVIRDFDRAEEGLVCHEPPRRDGETLWLPSRRPHRPGAGVFLTSRKARSTWYSNLMKDPNQRFSGSIPLDITLTVSSAGVPVIDVKAEGPGGRAVHLLYESPARFEEALTRPLSADQIREQFLRSSHPVIQVRTLDINYNGGLFAPVSLVNGIRRDMIQRVETALLSGMHPGSGEIEEANKRCSIAFSRDSGAGTRGSGDGPGQIVVMTDSLVSASAARAAGCHQILYDCSLVTRSRESSGRDLSTPRTPDEVIAELSTVIRQSEDEGVALSWKLPRVIDRHTMTTILSVLPRLAASGVRGVVSDNPWMPSVFPDLHGVTWTAGPGCNIVNGWAARALDPGFKTIITSPEASVADISHIASDSGRRISTLVQGLYEMMITEDRLFDLFRRPGITKAKGQVYGIRDGSNRFFSLAYDSAGRVVIRNAVETCLIDYLPTLIEAGVRDFLIDARGRPPEYCQTATGLYREALRCAAMGPPPSSRKWQGFRRRAKGISLGGMTIGHLFMRTPDHEGMTE